MGNLDAQLGIEKTEKCQCKEIESEYGTIVVSTSLSPEFDGGRDELIEVLTQVDLLVLFEDITGLSPTNQTYYIDHKEKDADWEGLNLMNVRFSYGRKAYISAIHELVHIILRQQDWLNDEVLNSFIARNPEFTVFVRGEGYKIEQMIAYLVQREAAKYLDDFYEDTNFIEKFNDERFEDILKSQYQTPKREKLGRLIIKLWNERDRSLDIISFARLVAIRYDELGAL